MIGLDPAVLSYNKVLVFSEDELIYISDIYDENINYLTNGISFLSSCDDNKCVEKTIIINKKAFHYGTPG